MLPDMSRELPLIRKCRFDGPGVLVLDAEVPDDTLVISKTLVDFSLQSDQVTELLVVDLAVGEMFGMFDDVSIADLADYPGPADGHASWMVVVFDDGS